MKFVAASATVAVIVSVVSSAVVSFNATSSSYVERDAGYGFVAGTASWTSKPGPFLLLDNGIGYFLQSDGNLVVYDTHANNVLWNSGVTNQDCSNAKCTLAWHSDGNLVALTNDSPLVAFWNTGTNPFDKHQVAGNGLYFSPNPPYISIYTQAPALLWMTQG